jgi:TolB-like protein/tetratricopeptide (TPR) repeat protein
MKAFLEELKHRKVFRVGIAYAVAAWLLIQIIATVKDALRLPEWSDTLIIILLAIGFPIALILAWAYDVTPAGIRRAEPAAADDLPAPSGAAAPPRALEAPTEHSIAVLPFVNMSSDPEQEYFSDGISEELLNQLVMLKGLHVAGRTSCFSFKGKNEDLRVIGEKLKVAHILEGSVRKSGNKIRITAQLIKASDGFHLWSKTFDRDLDDIFAIQDETAKAVANTLSLILGVGETLHTGGTKNVEAYDAYLAGLARFRGFARPDLQQAIHCFEEAVAHDPGFPEAWAFLAETYDTAAHTFISEESASLAGKSRDAAARAIDLAPDSPASLRAASLLALRDRDWATAERHLRRTLQIVPGDGETNEAYARFLLYVGRAADAVTYARRAANIDPLSLQYNLNLAGALQINCEPDKALAQYRHTATLPGNKAFLHALTIVLGMEMQDREIIDEHLAALTSTNPATQHPSEVITRDVGQLLDAPGDALEILRRFAADPAHDNPLGRTIITVWAAYFGDDVLALEQFQALIDKRVVAWFIIWRPIQKNMRRLPAFKQLLLTLGLVDYWQATGNWSAFVRPNSNGDFEVYR